MRKTPSSVPSAARSKLLAWTFETIATGTTWWLPIRRPGKWTAERLFLLLAQIASYKRRRPKAPADTDICRWLKKSYPDETVEAVRRALQDARNPKRNSELARLADVVARSATGNRTGALDEAATAKGV